MKTSELNGALLDLWVARAEGKCVTVQPGVWGMALINELGRCSISANTWEGARYFEPSTKWAQSGPIIERERIDVETPLFVGGWTATLETRTSYHRFDGPTPLVAAMRAYVASKFGDEVPDDSPVGADRRD